MTDLMKQQQELEYGKESTFDWAWVSVSRQPGIKKPFLSPLQWYSGKVCVLERLIDLKIQGVSQKTY